METDCGSAPYQERSLFSFIPNMAIYLMIFGCVSWTVGALLHPIIGHSWLDKLSMFEYVLAVYLFGFMGGLIGFIHGIFLSVMMYFQKISQVTQVR